MAKRPTVCVCKGKRCSKPAPARKALVAALESVARVERVGCQKVCAGPVAGVEVDGTLEWFRELDSAKARAQLVKLVDKGKMSKALQKRWVKKRSGQKR